MFPNAILWTPLFYLYLGKHSTMLRIKIGWGNVLEKLEKNLLVYAEHFVWSQLYFMLLDNIDTNILAPTYIKVSKQDNLSLLNFKNEIIASEELHSWSTRQEEDPNVTYPNAKDKHIPSKLVKFDEHIKSKWITYGIMKSVQYRDNLYKKT